MVFTDEQLERHPRNIILSRVGARRQGKLSGTEVLIIGAGNLGTPVAFYLTATGVGTIGIVDTDKVDLSSLQ